MTTIALLRRLPNRRPRACCRSCASFGDDGVDFDARALALDAAGRVQGAIDAVATLPSTIADSIADATIGAARRQIVATQQALSIAAATAVERGATTVANSLGTLAWRAGEAAAALGRGAGEAFRAFWGLPPSVVFGVPLVLGGAAMLALALSPGGQGYSLAVGRGLGSALGSVGAGWGGAARDVARTLPALVKL